MKKYFKIAFVYLILALASGVFHREFTKFNQFDGKTTLAVTHLHFFVLGTLFFLILALINNIIDIQHHKLYKPFMICYNIGLPLMVVMFYVRGIIQVLEVNISNSISSMISGFAGIAHILVGVSLVFIFTILIKKAK